MSSKTTLRSLLGSFAAATLLVGAGTAAQDPATPAPMSPDVARNDHRIAPWPKEVVKEFESLPIQDGGRVKPLYTFASFTMLRLHGKRSLKTDAGEELGPVEWMLDTLFFPEASVDYPSFIVQNSEVIDSIGLRIPGKKKRDEYTFRELQPGLQKLFQLAHQYTPIEEKDRTSVQQQIVVLSGNVDTYLRLLGSMDFARMPMPVSEVIGAPFLGRQSVDYHEVVAHGQELFARFQDLSKDPTKGREGELPALSTLLRTASDAGGQSDLLAILPPVASPAQVEEWRSPYDLFAESLEGPVPDAEIQQLASLERLARSRGDMSAFTSELASFHDRAVGMAKVRGEYGKIPLEVDYYHWDLVMRSLATYVLAFLLMAFMWLFARNELVSRWLYRGTVAAVGVGTGLLVGAIAIRCTIRGRPPVSTLYETVLFVTAVGSIVALFAEWITRRRMAIATAAVLGMVGMFVANGYEMIDKRDTMPSLVAVLDTNFWLATHVTAITIGYSAGMLAALLASFYLLAKPFKARFHDPSFFKNLSRMVYGVLCFGLIFSAVGTILGGIWANESWGRFWGWDPKENGALLIVLGEIAILHGRMGGYLREHTLCMAAAFLGSIVGFSWWGVNLLGVGLHSYGFTSGIHTALWTYYGIQWGIVGIGGVTWMLERARAKPRTAALPSKTPKRETAGAKAGEAEVGGASI